MVRVHSVENIDMNPSEIDAALQAAFSQCDKMLCPLSEKQKQILLQVVVEELIGVALGIPEPENGDGDRTNPLAELTSEQRRVLLQFVKEQERENRPWKIKLLNDWLNNQDSGEMQFIRDRYGFQWLNRVQPVHLAEYYQLKLKVGDRIEVSNALWEWVQENGPCSREWFPCTVVRLSQGSDSSDSYHNGIIRFDNGTEYEIQGICEWNRYNWRYVSD